MPLLQFFTWWLSFKAKLEATFFAPSYKPWKPYRVMDTAFPLEREKGGGEKESKEVCYKGHTLQLSSINR